MTAAQPDLFTAPIPAQRHSDTSRAAAEAIADRAPSIAARVFRVLVGLGEVGATDEELADILYDFRPETVRARRVGLMHAGRVDDSGRRRPTASGNSAAVWIAVPQV